MILDKILPRASLEDPTTPLTGYNLTIDQIARGGGGTSDTGEVITGKTALRNSAVWAGVDIISSSVGKLPIHIKRQTEAGKEVFTSHPAHRLLHGRPNDNMGPYTFKQILQAHATIYGTGYAYIQRDGGSTPTELVPLLPDQTWVVTVEGVPWVVAQTAEGTTRIPAMDVLMIRGASFDGLMGYALSDIGRESIASGLAIRKFLNIFFKNGARPSIVLRHPGELSEEAAQRIRSSWSDMHQGMSNAHRAALLEEGMDVSVLGSTNEHAQTIEMLQWSVLDVARYLRLPPTKLFWLEQSTFENLNELERAFLLDCLDPWLTAWEEEINYKLLTEQEKLTGSVFAKFNTGKLLRMDTKSRYETHQIAIMSGFKTRNEVRDDEDLNPLEGLDDPLVPNSNATPQEPAEQPTEEVENSNTPTASQRNLVHQTLRRMATRLGTRARKASKAESNFLEYLEADFERNEREVVKSAIGDAVSVLAELRGDDPYRETDRLTDRLFVVLREELFAETEQHTRDTFAKGVETLTTDWLDRIPDQLTNEFLEGV